jgi:ketosteroid isomerase-like protein
MAERLLDAEGWRAAGPDESPASRPSVRVVPRQPKGRALMGEQSAEVVRGIYQALGRGDMAGVLGAMADDIKWYQAEGMPNGGVYQGGEAVAQYVFGPIMQDIPNFAVTPEQFIASGDTVAVVARYTGTGKETGKELDLPVAHVFDVRDGKVVQFRQFVDTAKFRESWPG